jgi:GNAT superfamily N-acetyltransferase
MTDAENVQVNLPVRMVRDSLDVIPEYPLPDAYSVRWYQPGDEALWLEVQQKGERLIPITPELYEREFGDERELLCDRQCFIMNKDDQPVGTATAWLNRDYKGRDYGRVHWLAIIPSEQGKGLGNALLAITLHRLRELGHDRAYLVTSTARLPAIRLYTKFGFVPDIGSDEDRENWSQLARGRSIR